MDAGFVSGFAGAGGDEAAAVDVAPEGAFGQAGEGDGGVEADQVHRLGGGAVMGWGCSLQPLRCEIGLRLSRGRLTGSEAVIGRCDKGVGGQAAKV